MTEALNDHDVQDGGMHTLITSIAGLSDDEKKILEVVVWGISNADAFLALASGEMVAIKTARLVELEHAEDILLALQAAGVDNWDGYDDAIEALEGFENDR